MSEPFLAVETSVIPHIMTWSDEAALDPGFADGNLDNAEDVGQWLANIGSGAATGAATGAAAGPWGALIGGLLGGGMGAVQTALAQNQPQQPRPPGSAPPGAPGSPPSTPGPPAQPSMTSAPVAVGTVLPAQTPAARGTADPGTSVVAQLSQLIPVLATLATQLGAATAAKSPTAPAAAVPVTAAKTLPSPVPAPATPAAPSSAEVTGDEEPGTDDAVEDRDGTLLGQDEAAGPWLASECRTAGDDDGGDPWSTTS
jgi:hypothetical protein